MREAVQLVDVPYNIDHYVILFRSDMSDLIRGRNEIAVQFGPEVEKWAPPGSHMAPTGSHWLPLAPTI